jgi:DNA-binding NtrC family response regulator
MAGILNAVKQTVDNLIGVSPAMQAVRAEVEHAARCHAKVLITGESGVGKEVASRLIHYNGSRAQVPLVAINCVGIPESLLESELFGHVRGSFTGAHRDRVGLLEMAHGGTVFLDEVGEMGPRMQGLLLRFLETGEIQRVGADRMQPRLDVRVIAATNRDLLSEVANKNFREDLYYRLNVIEITIPPLRQRREDIHVLLDHYLRKHAEQHGVAPPALSPEAVKWLVNYEWPGNVRQLRNVVERLIVRRGGSEIGVEDLPSIVRGRPQAPAGDAGVLRDSGDLSGHVTFVSEAAGASVVDTMFERMVKHRESFWSIVYSPFMVRDLTRSDLRAIITRGLEETSGSYKMLVELFNMDPSDYKRFLNFLRKQECQVPFAAFRAVRSRDRGIPQPRFAPAHGGNGASSNSHLRH